MLPQVERLKEQRRAARLAREDATAKRSGERQTSADVGTSAARMLGKADRLQQDSRVLVSGLTSETGALLNGKHGRVVAYLFEKDRFQLEMENSGQVVNLRRENLTPRDGERMNAPTSSSASGVSKAPMASGWEGAGSTGHHARDESSVLSRLQELKAEWNRASVSVNACASALNRVDFEDVEADEVVSAVAVDASDALASVAKLNFGLDALDLDGIGDHDSRQEARARRKALRVQLDEDLGPAADQLRTAIAQAQRRVANS